MISKLRWTLQGEKTLKYCREKRDR